MSEGGAARPQPGLTACGLPPTREGVLWGELEAALALGRLTSLGSAQALWWDKAETNPDLLLTSRVELVLIADMGLCERDTDGQQVHVAYFCVSACMLGDGVEPFLPTITLEL